MPEEPSEMGVLLFRETVRTIPALIFVKYTISWSGSNPVDNRSRFPTTMDELNVKKVKRCMGIAAGFNEEMTGIEGG